MIIIKESTRFMQGAGEDLFVVIDISNFDYKKKKTFIDALYKDVEGFNKKASNFSNGSRTRLVIDNTDQAIKDLEQVFIRYGLLNSINTLTKRYDLRQI